MNFRRTLCNLLSILRIHNQNCEHCKLLLTSGTHLQKRLNELNSELPWHIPEGGFWY